MARSYVLTHSQQENVCPERQLNPPTSASTHTQSTDRTKRVKDARSEAQKEIEDYRKQKEQEFQAFEKEVQHPPTSLYVQKRQPR